MKTWKVEAAIIAVGMVLLGVIIKWGINDFIDKNDLILLMTLMIHVLHLVPLTTAVLSAFVQSAEMS